MFICCEAVEVGGWFSRPVQKASWTTWKTISATRPRMLLRRFSSEAGFCGWTSPSVPLKFSTSVGGA